MDPFDARELDVTGGEWTRDECDWSSGCLRHGAIPSRTMPRTQFPVRLCDYAAETPSRRQVRIGMEKEGALADERRLGRRSRHSIVSDARAVCSRTHQATIHSGSVCNCSPTSGRQQEGVSQASEVGAVAALLGLITIFACLSGSPSAAKAASTPGSPTVPVTMDAALTLPSASRCKVSRNSSGV
jgi:hypothetical protein